MKTVTYAFIVVFFTILSFQSCIIDMHGVRGNGNIVSKEIAISDYTEIDAGGVAEIIYEQQTVKSPYLQVNVDENIFPLLDIRVENNKLIIKSKDNGNIQPSRFKIYTNSVNIERIKLAGSGEVHLKGEVNSRNMKIDLAGSGDIIADSLYCEQFDMSVAGSGTARLKGACNNSRFAIAGSGDIKGYNFSVQDLDCKIAGSGDIQITVGRSLNANVAGSGDLKYYGSPEIVNTKIAGSGEIKKMN
ncbi:MAG: DUF2807 domain-containing protein [Dysgonamonadaceae bacterium]|jgi:hypothetical protein|nr:DUF2807 domain-containing protein [Dysgonamonadaceae bacterium]